MSQKPTDNDITCGPSYNPLPTGNFNCYILENKFKLAQGEMK
jgi:hypothetical protein